MATFSHRHAYSASLHCPISIRAIDPVCPQAILPMGVTLFSSGMLCVTNIPSINRNDILFCLKLNGEHTGEFICRYALQCLRYVNVKLKIVDFDLS